MVLNRVILYDNLFRSYFACCSSVAALSTPAQPQSPLLFNPFTTVTYPALYETQAFFRRAVLNRFFSVYVFVFHCCASVAIPSRSPQSGGRALLMLLPSEEEGVLARLKPKNIPIKKLTINPDKVGDWLYLCRGGWGSRLLVPGTGRFCCELMKVSGLHLAKLYGLLRPARSGSSRLGLRPSLYDGRPKINAVCTILRIGHINQVTQVDHSSYPYECPAVLALVPSDSYRCIIFNSVVVLCTAW